ncbi:T-complex protein 11-like protein 1 isoform X1 [Polyodon spathula]|uniref:T-complex protein 11-like protein 1 isoform X1 n=2 Tax=Polyodon spathula TaxID=7913 RepID=UPI001B7E740C|nr:T-complex protein 11-like protein 1 isoform X1 [Polyodon spathula]XP_041131840.1 T-complex protein 11-like protein 1 isoform X1 [Polyodon spathula]
MPLGSDKPGCSEEDKLSDSSESRNRADTSEQALGIRQRTPSPHRGNTPQSSPRFASVEELMETAKGVSNMALAHEIVVSDGFRLKPSDPAEGSLEKRVQDIVHKAFWDCLEVQLGEDPPAYDHAIKLLGEIKETLLSFLLPGHSRLRNQINEVVDLDLIKQEAENGALDINKVVEFIIGMMGTLCAPARDEEIRKLRDITAIVPLFKAIFSVLDLMKIDMANFAVSSIRPHLMQQSVEYERTKFQEFIEKQHNALDFTQRWLEAAANSLVNSGTEATLAPPGAAASAGPALCPLTVHNHAYMSLLRWNHKHTPFPETMLMDQSRFEEMQMALEQLTIVAAVLLIAYNVTGAALSGLPGFADKLKGIVNVLLAGMHLPSFNMNETLATIGEKLCVEVNSCLSQHGFTQLSADKASVLKGQTQAVTKPDNSIRKLIDSRIQTFLLSYLDSSHHKSSPVIPGGLVPIQKELEEIAVKFSRLVNYNKMVFAPQYEKILKEILSKDESHSTGKSAGQG